MQPVRIQMPAPSTRSAGKGKKPYFVGRERETRTIIRALEQGKNVVISGRYGIGRTRLVRHVADKIQDRWRFVFVDFSQTPARASNDLLAALFPGRQSGSRDSYVRYKSSRFQIGNLKLEDRRAHVIVLDDITRLSTPRLNFIRHLVWDKRFHFIAIADASVPSEALFRLRSALRPAAVMVLSYLPLRNRVEFFRHFSREYGFDWAESQIDMLAKSTGGYPLEMVERVVKEARGTRL